MPAGLISSPHLERPDRVDQLMRQVILALLPGILALWWFFGWGVLIQASVAVTAALATEALALRLRDRPASPALRDFSAVVTALLFAVSVPPTLPWWLNGLGMLFAIGVVKQLYGGLGYNPFNPAMAAYVLLLVSYPVAMTAWLPPTDLATHPLSLPDTLALIFQHRLPPGATWDTITSATPLDRWRDHIHHGRTLSDALQHPLWGTLGGRGWEGVGLAFLAGGLWMLWQRVITWRISVAVLIGLGASATLAYGLDAQHYPGPWFHLFSGGTLLGAFFIATDPVTATTTERGQWVYGLLIGGVVFLIRSFGGYPDAFAFSVLLMNLAAPTIDRYTQPRVFGHGD
ncbi:Ion-translocating oxidoreductase complex subunit D [Gammaproteobacteria bacterium]